MINATTDTKKSRIIKNTIEITQVFNRVTDDQVEHVNFTALTDPASNLLEVASYRDTDDNEERVVSDMIIPFRQAKVLKDLLNNPFETALLKEFLNRPDVSAYLV